MNRQEKTKRRVSRFERRISPDLSALVSKVLASALRTKRGRDEIVYASDEFRWRYGPSDETISVLNGSLFGPVLSAPLRAASEKCRAALGLPIDFEGDDIAIFTVDGGLRFEFGAVLDNLNCPEHVAENDYHPDCGECIAEAEDHDRLAPGWTSRPTRSLRGLVQAVRAEAATWRDSVRRSLGARRAAERAQLAAEPATLATQGDDRGRS